MSLEAAILQLAEAITKLALTNGAQEPRDGHVIPYGPPTFDQWFSEQSDVRINSLSHKTRKQSECSICGQKGVNSRTHPHHGGL